MADDTAGQPPTQDEEQVQSLIQGRAKRSTAGLRMSALLDAEADDELSLLFQEADDDNEFSVAAGEEGPEEDDMGLDSSSDDEDQGPNARADDFEGETQIQKEEKAEKKKRRAQQDLRYKIASKKVKIDPTAVSVVPATPRPKKKSERISWIPTPEEGPTRSSSRRQTMQNKELTHARLKDNEEKRIRLIATMEEAAKRKAHLKPKEMTQAERLAEAERVEKHNSKSLNRWEEMEKRKAEERKAKIEALQNRRLEGPVMSYWSGIATWADGRLIRLGKVDVTAKPEKEDNTRKKSKKSDKEGKAVTEPKAADNSTSEAATGEPTPKPTSESAIDPVVPAEGDTSKDNSKEKRDTPQIEKTDTAPQQNSARLESATITATDPSIASAPPTAQAVKSLPDDTQGAEIAATAEPPKDSTGLPDETTEGKVTEEAPKEAPKEEQGSENRADGKPEDTPKDPALATQDMDISSDAPTPKPEGQGTQPPSEGNTNGTSKEPVAEPATAQLASKTTTAPQEVSPTTAPDVAPDTAIVSALPNQHGETPAATQQEQVAPEVQPDQPAATSEETPQPGVPPPPKVIEQTGRTLTVLENFDDKTAQSREFSIYFNAKKPPRLTKISSSLCVITSLPSRYRDPETSLPFANSYAYHEIRNAVAQKYTWSSMLGCYVGPAGVAAKGVPERFLDPQAPPPPSKRGIGKKDSNSDTEPAATGNDKVSEVKASPDVPSTPTPAVGTPTPAVATPTPGTTAEAGTDDPMEVDKP
ncbi:hypothetical protein BBP40_001964 [Aspergillus hancockii]|nr:hypothetical protein BBP40_001964 [Aspergillus hancockii]